MKTGESIKTDYPRLSMRSNKILAPSPSAHWYLHKRGNSEKTSPLVGEVPP